jgi:hypothetical protein
MKTKIIILILCTMASAVFAQKETADNTKYRNEKNIYNLSLIKYLDYLYENRKILQDTVLIEIDSEIHITDSLLQQIGKTAIFKLNFTNKEDYFKKHKVATVCKLFPLSFENGEFRVSIVPFGVSYKYDRNTHTRHYHYVNGGGYVIVYKFADNQFIFDRVEEWGI